MIYHVATCLGEGALGSLTAIVTVNVMPTDDDGVRMTQELDYSETGFLHVETQQVVFYTKKGRLPFCGHTALAAAFVIDQLDGDVAINLVTDIGGVEMTRCDGGFRFEVPSPAYTPVNVDVGFGVAHTRAYLGRDLLLLYDSADAVRGLVPDMQALLDAPGLLVHCAANVGAGEYVYRTFGPKVDVSEDDACASAQGLIAPIMVKKQGCQAFIARQLSPRGGLFRVYVEDDGVFVTAYARMVV